MVVKYMTNRKILASFEYTSNFLFKSVMFKHLFESFTSFVDVFILNVGKKVINFMRRTQPFDFIWLMSGD
ncbi:MAG: hypothetical protein CMQ40_03475 [Gammaproteobacteria bacterium]|nr:hypothetical protein [Gammaproteobacteria bacterium]